MLEFLKGFEKYTSIFMLSVMCICIILQVIFRYVFRNALDWPDEVARYTFICAAFLGASMAAGEGRHLEISIAKNLFGPKVKIVVTIVSAAATMFFCGLMVVWGVGIVQFIRQSGQVAASFNMPMYILYIVVPVSMACMLFRTFTFTAATVRRLMATEETREDRYKEASNSW